MQEIESVVTSIQSKKILSLYSSLSLSLPVDLKVRCGLLLSQSPCVLVEDILSHPQFPWDWRGVSRNPSLSLSDILSHPEIIEWDWKEVSRNPSLTFEDVLSHPQFPWDWKGVSRNPSLTLEEILSHPQFP